MADGPGMNTGGHAPWAQDRRFMFGALGIVLLLTFADFFGGTGSIKESNAQKVSNDAPKFATKFMGPSIKFLYCYS